MGTSARVARAAVAVLAAIVPLLLQLPGVFEDEAHGRGGSRVGASDLLGANGKLRGRGAIEGASSLSEEKGCQRRRQARAR